MTTEPKRRAMYLLQENYIPYNILFNEKDELIIRVPVSFKEKFESLLNEDLVGRNAEIEYLYEQRVPIDQFWKRLTKDCRPSFEKPVFVGRYSNEKMESAVGILDEVKETSDGFYFFFNVEDKGCNIIGLYDFYAEIPMLPELKETE